MKNIPRDAREVYLNERGEPIAYCPNESLGIADMERALFYHANEERLLQLAQRAEEKTQAEGVCYGVICIDVDDPTFLDIVEALIPGHDWQAYRDQGQRPCARGVLVDELLRALVDDFFPAAKEEFKNQQTNILVCASGGCSVFHRGES